jgi:hypothetical protein
MAPLIRMEMVKERDVGHPQESVYNWNPVWVHECYCKSPWLQHLLWSVGMLSPRGRRQSIASNGPVSMGVVKMDHPLFMLSSYSFK